MGQEQEVLIKGFFHRGGNGASVWIFQDHLEPNHSELRASKSIERANL